MERLYFGGYKTVFAWCYERNINKNIENWLSKIYSIPAEFYLSDTIIRNLLMAEHYNAHGSPYWGLKAYIFLMLSDDHEFWSCDIEEMPKLDELKLIKEADMLVSRRNGKSVAYPAGTITDFACGQIVPKYLKFAYSAHFGFNVMRSNVSIDEAACDSMLTFCC